MPEIIFSNLLVEHLLFGIIYGGMMGKIKIKQQSIKTHQKIIRKCYIVSMILPFSSLPGSYVHDQKVGMPEVVSI